MLSGILKRFTYANVAMTLALVFAVTGGAYAASKYVVTSTKQIKPSVLKQLQGKTGKAGAAGPQGPAGPAGSQGPAGGNGKDGSNGASGESVSVAAAGAGECNKEGGAIVSNATGKVAVCNGKTGFTSTLPKGETEKGDWSILADPAGTGLLDGSAATAISFNIPLAAAPTPIYVKAGEPTPAGCMGNVENPGAEAGHLCVFSQFEHNLGFPASICGASVGQDGVLTCAAAATGVAETADPTGALVAVTDENAGTMWASGTWAVTAE